MSCAIVQYKPNGGRPLVTWGMLCLPLCPAAEAQLRQHTGLPAARCNNEFGCMCVCASFFLGQTTGGIWTKFGMDTLWQPRCALDKKKLVTPLMQGCLNLTFIWFQYLKMFNNLTLIVRTVRYFPHTSLFQPQIAGPIRNKFSIGTLWHPICAIGRSNLGFRSQ